MNTALTHQELGSRIAQLRKVKGYSQEEVAHKIGLSRTALTQIELGKRSASALEAYRISSCLGISLDQLLAESFVQPSEAWPNDANPQEVNRERESSPKLQLSKLKNVILYLLERCSGKPNVGETVLYKLLYFADFNYYELHEEHLTGATYRKLPFGPVPKDIDFLLQMMLEQGELQRIKTEYFGYTQTRYIPLKKADLSELNANEKAVIDFVIEQMSDWSAAKISEYAHKDIPWLVSKDGDEINYELAFYRESPFSVRNYDEEADSL